jgi:hypothetical protein
MILVELIMLYGWIMVGLDANDMRKTRDYVKKRRAEAWSLYVKYKNGEIDEDCNSLITNDDDDGDGIEPGYC